MLSDDLNDEVGDMLRPPLGYSVHLAIADYCKYGGTCPGPDLDATIDAGAEFYKLATQRGFLPATTKAPQFLVDGDASRANLKVHIAAAQALLSTGDYFVVTFAGYGIEPPLFDLSGATRGWILTDGDFYTFRELFVDLSVLVGVRVLVVSNSCRSGGVIGALVRVVRRIVRVVVSIFGRTPRYQSEALSLSENGPVIVHLAGCQASEDLPDSTDFSDVVYDVVTAGSWNFVKFFDALSKKYPAELPKLPSLSPDADKISDSGFKTAGPFTIQ